jgi:hypothetical protein
MAAHGTPGAAVAVVRGGEVDHDRVERAGERDPRLDPQRGGDGYFDAARVAPAT